MDDAQEVERNRAAQAVSAKVHTRAGGRVSFGEPEENGGAGPKPQSLSTFVDESTGDVVWCRVW